MRVRRALGGDDGGGSVGGGDAIMGAGDDVGEGERAPADGERRPGVGAGGGTLALGAATMPECEREGDAWYAASGGILVTLPVRDGDALVGNALWPGT